MFSRKYTDGSSGNVTLPMAPPVPRFHPPCTHGPITIMLTTPGFCSSMALYVLSGP